MTADEPPDLSLTLNFSVYSTSNTMISGAGYTYHISTPSAWCTKPTITTIHRNFKLVAEIHWRRLAATTVRLGGEKGGRAWVPLDQFLKRDRLFS